MGVIETVADFNDLCGEGPLWNDAEQALCWIDIVGEKFSRLFWPGRRSEIVRADFAISGFVLAEGGGYVMVNRSGVWRWDGGAAAPVLIAGSGDGHRCALNDCIADPQGRLFSGSVFYDPEHPELRRGCLFRVDTNGAAQVVDEGFGISNGLGFSPDARTLYFADSAERVIYAYDYRREDGSIRNRRRFVTVPRDQGIPDGLTVDADGFVWSAQWFAGAVVRYDPDGAVERVVPVPAAQSSAVAFGGPGLTDIFITSAAQRIPTELAPPNYDPGGYPGGKLFHLNAGIRGKVEYPARITIAS